MFYSGIVFLLFAMSGEATCCSWTSSPESVPALGESASRNPKCSTWHSETFVRCRMRGHISTGLKRYLERWKTEAIDSQDLKFRNAFRNIQTSVTGLR